MAVLGLGIDLVDLHRVRRILNGPRGEKFKHRICTEQEREACDRRPDPSEGYAARFAAKEAFVKALGVPKGLRWHDVEVVRGGGKPTLWIKGKGVDFLKERGIKRLHLSLTHDTSSAAAVVVLED